MKYVTDDGKYYDNIDDALNHEKAYKKKESEKKKRRTEVAKAYDDYLALKEKYQQELDQKFNDYLKIKKAYENDYKKVSDADSNADVDDFYNFLRKLL